MRHRGIPKERFDKYVLELFKYKKSKQENVVDEDEDVDRGGGRGGGSSGGVASPESAVANERADAVDEKAKLKAEETETDDAGQDNVAESWVLGVSNDGDVLQTLERYHLALKPGLNIQKTLVKRRMK